MTVSSVGASASAYYYLQSLLPPPSADGGQASGDPVTQLLNAFYPNGTQSGPATDSAGGTSSGAGPAAPLFSPDTMTSLMSVQEQPSGVNPFVAAHAQALFSQLDANGDGQVSKSEFEDIFGSNADMSKVDGLFNALDGNGDGSVSQDELTSAMQASHAHHHHHHHANPGQGVGDIVQALLSGAQGATANTTSNSDGSSTTTISYTDGSSISLNTPAASTDASSTGSSSTDSGSTDSGSSGTGSNSTGYFNLLEQLIRLQAQSLSALASQTQATSQTLATV
jgi:EF hand domain-containing protein